MAYWWVNWDMSLGSYVLQDIRECGMFFLMCTFWDLGRQRLEIVRSILEDAEKWPDDTVDRLIFARSVFQRALSLWQASTILMLILFVPWSFFYWHQIVVNKDARYLPAVLMIDLLWMITWFVASRPFLFAMRCWNGERLRAISAWSGDVERLKALLEDGSNSSELQVVIATLTAVGSMLLPLAKAFFVK